MVRELSLSEAQRRVGKSHAVLLRIVSCPFCGFHECYYWYEVDIYKCNNPACSRFWEDNEEWGIPVEVVKDRVRDLKNEKFTRAEILKIIRKEFPEISNIDDILDNIESEEVEDEEVDEEDF